MRSKNFPKASVNDTLQAKFETKEETLVTQQTNPMVRIATADDIDMIAEFNRLIALETEGKELDAETVRRGVDRGMQRGPEVTYYVAEVEAQVVGTVMLTREWSDWRDGWMAWMQSVYVHQEHRGSGVFRGMLQHVITALQAQPDVIGLRLYVDNTNERAQRVYKASGFVDSEYMVLERCFGSE